MQGKGALKRGGGTWREREDECGTPGDRRSEDLDRDRTGKGPEGTSLERDDPADWSVDLKKSCHVMEMR
jgi:hypothetical protein